MNQETTYKITASIVLYKENKTDLTESVNSFLALSEPKKLFLIDNAPTSLFANTFDHPDVEYIFTGKNLGFGAGHNLVLARIKDQSDFHLILNPDVCFKPNVIPSLLAILAQNHEVALIAPKVIYPNGKWQPTCRRYPSLGTLLLRRIPIIRGLVKKTIQKGEYSDRDVTQPFEPDFLHGCFLLFKTTIFVKLKGFDERYFLYMEDIDICRKLDQLQLKKLFYPKVSIVHKFRKGSYKNPRLFLIHIKSVYNYFLKWGFSTKKR